MTTWHDDDGALICAWFLLCGNPATGVKDHPVLGDVPICDRCRKKVAYLEGDA